MQQDFSRIEFALGTFCSIDFYEKGHDRVYNEVFTRLREIDILMSRFIASSDISRINASAGIEPVHVHEDVFYLIEKAVYFARISSGAFDPTVGPLVSLWGITGNDPRVPSQEEIDVILPLINWQYIELDAVDFSVFLPHHGMEIDLGAIAKGYAADEALKIIMNYGVKRAKIDFGGNIIMYGERADRNPWRVGIQNPIEMRGTVLGIVDVKNESVVTSGVYERFFIEEDVRYHHIFFPFDGYPVNNGLLSVTIISENSLEADALSTAVFVMGFEKGRELIESLPGVEAVFVFDDFSVRKTSGANFTLTDRSFRLLN